ncbi:MAG TPA: phosphatidate cytidylyltransferase [Actinomycetota bacterium]|jgi:phosphatidate cytidylyltransferase
MARDEEDIGRELDDDPFRDLDRFFGEDDDPADVGVDGEAAAPPAQPPRAGVRPSRAEDARTDEFLPGIWKHGTEDLGETSDLLPTSVELGESPDLTVDALTKPPAEYRDLPVPEKEPPVEAPEHWEEATSTLRPEDPEDPDLATVEPADDEAAEELVIQDQDDLLADLLTPADTPVDGAGLAAAGPAWEEPTGAQPVVVEPVAPPTGRNIPMALLTAAVLAAAGLIALAISTAVFAVIVGAVVLFGQLELYAVMQRRGLQPATALGLVVGALILAGAYLRGPGAIPFFIVLGVVLSVLWYMAAPPKARDGALGNVGATLLGIVYAPLFASFVLLIVTQPSGRAITLAVLGLSFGYDVVGFFVGSVWGTRPLAPTISPKKTWRGLYAATVTTFALAIAILPSIRPIFTLATSVGFGLLVAVFAPLGDLAESFMKRDLGVKDMGSILPGHGGVLDRIDSVLFVAPAAYYFLRLIS